MKNYIKMFFSTALIISQFWILSWVEHVYGADHWLIRPVNATTFIIMIIGVVTLALTLAGIIMDKTDARIQ